MGKLNKYRSETSGQRGIRTAALIWLLREYIEEKAYKYAGYVDHIGSLREDEVELRSALAEQKDVIKFKLDEAKAHLKALQGH